MSEQPIDEVDSPFDPDESFDEDAAVDQADPPPAAEPDLLVALGAAITEPDTEAEQAARAHLAAGDDADLTAGGYGRLGELGLWWASVRGPDRAGEPPRQVLLAGGGVDVAARRPGVRALALPRGGTVDEAIIWGLGVADRAADVGSDLVVLCLDDTVPWRALAADLLGLDAVEVSDWPEDRGLSDEAWMDEVVMLRDQLRVVRGLRARPCMLLNALGSPPVAAAAAILIAATARRTPILLDGAGAAAVAMLGVRTNYAAPRWWQAAHRRTDRLHERILGSLGLEALTQLEIRRNDGTAGLAGLALLDAAVALLGGAGDADDPTGGFDDGYGV